jgi:hypothetical protein
MLQWLPRDAEQLAMESGCEYCERGVGGVQWRCRVCLHPGARRDDRRALTD